MSFPPFKLALTDVDFKTSQTKHANFPKFALSAKHTSTHSNHNHGNLAANFAGHTVESRAQHKTESRADAFFWC